jgi:hypothetical protein
MKQYPIIIDSEFCALIPHRQDKPPRPRQHDLQRRVIQILSLNINQMRDIVALCYSGVERKDRRKYQSAYAAVSRVLRRLESQGVVSLGHEAEKIICNYCSHNGQPCNYCNYSINRFSRLKSGGCWRTGKLNVMHGESDLTSNKLNGSHSGTDLTNAGSATK